MPGHPVQCITGGSGPERRSWRELGWNNGVGEGNCYAVKHGRASISITLRARGENNRRRAEHAACLTLRLPKLGISHLPQHLLNRPCFKSPGYSVPNQGRAFSQLGKAVEALNTGVMQSVMQGGESFETSCHSVACPVGLH